MLLVIKKLIILVNLIIIKKNFKYTRFQFIFLFFLSKYVYKL